MSVSLVCTGVQFPDGTIQTSAATQFSTIEYENRGTLRSTTPSANLTSLAVEDLGVFTYYANNTEPDDDISCFVVTGSGGAWRLLSPTLDFIQAYQMPEWEMLLDNRIVASACFCQGVSCIQFGATTITAACMPGAKVGDTVLATPLYSLCCLCTSTNPSYFATIPCDNCLWLYMSNIWIAPDSIYIPSVPCTICVRSGCAMTPFCGCSTIWKAVSIRSSY